MDGIIIYNNADAKKNEKFINICQEYFAANNIKLKLIIRDECKVDDAGEVCILDYIDEKTVFAINRARDYRISKVLEDNNIRVFNDSYVTEIGNDKWLTFNWAKKCGIPVLNSYTDWDREHIYPIVVKSVDGHGGNEVFLVNNEEQLKDVKARLKKNVVIQQFADTCGRDIRTYVLGGREVVSIERKATDGFKSNFSLGGSTKIHKLNKKEEIIVKKVISELNPDYIGIDIIYDREEPVLNEIEDAVGARMVYQNTDIDIIRMYAAHILETL